MKQIKTDMETAPKEKKQTIVNNIKCQIAGGDQAERQFHVFREKDFPKTAVYVADIHIDQGVKTDRFSKKYIQKQSRKEPGQKPALSLFNLLYWGSGKHKQPLFDQNACKRY